MNVDSVYPKVREIIADVLVVDEKDISLQKRLIADLGAESIDFLDLVFQLEKEFSIKIPRGQIEKGGVLTANGLISLKNYLSEIPAEHFKDNMKMNEIPMLFTVETFCKLIVAAVTEQTALETVV